MVSHSHARCRQCGRARHRSARFNLCEACWKELKPDIRAGWRQVKQRRHARLVEASVVTEVTPNGVAMEVATVGLERIWDRIRAGDLSKDDREELIAQIREIGLPPASTPERGLYLSLFRRRAGEPLPPKPEPEPVAEPEPVRLSRRRITPDQRAEIAALYADPANSIEDIKRTYGISDGALYRAVHDAGIPKRTTAGRKPQDAPQTIAVVAPTYVLERVSRWRVSFTAVREVDVEGTNVFDALQQAGEQYGEGRGLNVVKVEQL